MFTFPALALLLHIPDGFLNTLVAIACWAVTLGVLAFAIRKAQQDFDERLVPLAGIMGAFIFAAQMLNFPVAGGTSGHFVGAALAFIVLGPWLGFLTMTAVIVLQALLFQDGGLVVMGANVLVMGVVPGFAAYWIWRFGQNRSWGFRLGMGGIAAWVSIMAAALVTALLLAFSGTASLNIVLPAMLGVHALIGIGEAVITVAALAFIRQTRPGLLEMGSTQSARSSWILVALSVVLILLLFAPFASGHPDGLEWVAETTGFIDTAQDAPYTLLPDYTVPFLGETNLSTILAGVIGALVVGLVVWGAVKALRRTA